MNIFKNIIKRVLKGSEFEKAVEAVLQDLERKFPDRVKVKAQKDFLDASRPHRADFELEYKIGGLTHQHLIECQHRKASSHEIADKIYAIRGTSDRNRYIFVYKAKGFLSDPVAKRLKDMGVLCFEFEDFKTTFISQLEADLALHGLGASVLGNPELKSILDQLIREDKRGSLKTLLDSGVKYEPRRESPPDRGMISGR